MDSICKSTLLFLCVAFIVLFIILGCFTGYDADKNVETTITETTDKPTTEHTTTEPVITTTEEPTTEETTTEKVYEVEQDSLKLLSHLIYAEAGSSWCSDEMQIYVGSVVLNRMKSDDFPDSMYGVIYQKGQYACTWDGNINKTPDERTINNARYVLEHGSQLPDNVVFQAEFKQGSGVYCQIGNTYFCYR